MKTFQKTIFSVAFAAGFGSFAFAENICFSFTSAGNPYRCYSTGNCVWWAAYKRPDLQFMRGDAKQWFSDAQKASIPTGSEPKVGAIVVYGYGDNGHVAYVEKVNADGSFDVSEMNYTTDGYLHNKDGSRGAYLGFGVRNTKYTKNSLSGTFIGFIYSNLYSEIDGVGSLIDPKNKNTTSGDFDYVAIHPHEPGKRSSAIFQVVADASTCRYVTLSSYYNKVSDGFITVKEWSEHYPGEKNDPTISTVYKVTSLPATIPLVKDTWNLVSFTTGTAQNQTSPEDLIELKCGNLSSSGASGTHPQDIAPVIENRKSSPVSVLINNGDAFFSGSGSLISDANTSLYENRTSIQMIVNDAIFKDGYSRVVDEVVYLNGYKSKSYFQVYKQDTSIDPKCSKVEISNPRMAGVSWKQWSSDKAIDVVLTTATTYVVNLPKAKDWYIIGVISEVNNVNNVLIKAKCIP